jgi:hypothetical protein
MNRRVPGFWGFRKHGYSIQAVKDWRERECNAGRPSGLEDFSKAYGLCNACRANGNFIIGVHWADESGVEKTASLGSDQQPVSISQLVQTHNLNAFRWDYLYETCSTCRGIGKLSG